jgi:hypothetical protein
MKLLVVAYFDGKDVQMDAYTYNVLPENINLYHLLRAHVIETRLNIIKFRKFFTITTDDYSVLTSELCHFPRASRIGVREYEYDSRCKMKLKIAHNNSASNKTFRFIKEILRDKKLDDEYDTESDEESSFVSGDIIEVSSEDPIDSHNGSVVHPPQDEGKEFVIPTTKSNIQENANYKFGGLESISRLSESYETTEEMTHDIEDLIYCQEDEPPPSDVVIDDSQFIEDVIESVFTEDHDQPVNSSTNGFIVRSKLDDSTPINQLSENASVINGRDFQTHRCWGLGGEVIEINLPNLSKEKIMNILMLLSIYFIEIGKFRIVDDHVESNHRGYILCDYIVNRSFHTLGRFWDRVSRFRQ